MRFDELYLSDDILDAIDSMHFTECTPIQEKTIPLITEGRDVIAVAQTGTGKTAAYLLPVIDEIANGDYPQDAINCIVMAPTRELAQQIDQQMQGFAYFMPVSSVAIYGGTDGHTFEQQKKGLKLGADVVIATPGRLIAHLSMGYVDLSKVSFLILDEADRMLDMGFYEDIMQIVKQLSKERQTLLFSATMPPKIKKLAKEILNNPAEVKLAVSKPADKIDQSAYVCYETQKIPILCHIFKTLQCDRSIVFASSKVKCKELCKALKGLNLSVGEMHSDLEQSRREDVLLDFKAGKIKILVATDIMARGIDIDDIGLVVNFDVPHENEDYVHRIGRTARANTDGIAITFVSEKEIGKFMRIEKFIEKEIKKNEIPAEIGEGPEYAEKGRRGRSGKGGDKKPQDKKQEKQEKQKKNRKKGKQKAAPEVAADAKPAAETKAAASKANETAKKANEAEAVKTANDAEAAKTDTATAAPDAQLAESAVATSEPQPGQAETTADKQTEPASEDSQTPSVADESGEATHKKKRKRRRSRKKKKGAAEVSEENTAVSAPAAAEPSDEESPKEEVHELNSVFKDRPVSYSLVAATMAAAARERAEREAEELRAREAETSTESADKAEATAAEAETVEEVQTPVATGKKRRKRGGRKRSRKETADDTAPQSAEEAKVGVPAVADIPEAAKDPARVSETPAETEPAEAAAEAKQTEAKPKRRTSRKKKSDEQQTSDAADNAAEKSEEAVEEKTEAPAEEKPKRRRSSKKTNAEEAVLPSKEETKSSAPEKSDAETAKDAIEPSAAEASAADAAAEEKPKRRATRKKKVEAEPADATSGPAATADTAAEEKPKRRTTRKKKAESTDAATTEPAAPEAAATPEPAAEEKPKRRTTRKKKVEADAEAAEPSSDTQAEEKPKRRRSTKKAADGEAEPAEEKPKRRTRKKASPEATAETEEK